MSGGTRRGVGRGLGKGAGTGPCIAVIGGGITGLAAAYYALRETSTADVVLLEASERFGGMIRTIRRSGFVLDAGPDGFLTRKAAARELCRDLGMEDQLVPRREGRRAAYIRRDGTLHKLPSSMRLFVPLSESELLNSGILSPDGARRVFREPEIPGRTEEESIARFFTRHFGEEMYRYIAEPLAAGIFAGDGETLSMEANFPELPRLERANDGPIIPALRAERAERAGQAEQAERAAGAPPAAEAHNDDIFRSFSGGLETLTEAIVHNLRDHRRCRLEPGTPVTTVTRHGDAGWTVTVADGRTFPVDAVICALPAREAAAVLAPLDEELARDLEEIPYSRSTAVFLAYADGDIPVPLDGSGYLVPRAEGTPVLACTWCSRKWPGRAPEGTELFRVFLAHDEDPVRTARRELAETLGIRAEPLLTETVHFPRAIPQYTLGHRERLARIRARWGEQAGKGLYLAGAALEGVGIPDCIRSGRESARAAVTAALPFARPVNSREEINP